MSRAAATAAAVRTARSSCASPPPTRPTRSSAGIAIRPGPPISPWRARRATATASSSPAPASEDSGALPDPCLPRATGGGTDGRARALRRGLMAEPLADPEEVRAHLVARRARRARRSPMPRCSSGSAIISRGRRCAQLCAMLGDVDRDAEARGEPELAVLVVRAERRHSRARAGGSPAAAARAAMKGLGKGRRRPASSAPVQGETFAFWQSGNGTVPDRAAR